MYARSITMRISPRKVDYYIGYVRDEVMPMVTTMDGCVGLSLLVDRENGRCITTSAWATEEAARASREALREARDRAAETFATVPEIEDWEIAVMHRAHRVADGACARLAWLRTGPANLDRVIDAYGDSIMPWWEETPGFCSNSLMVDRQEGRCASTVVFESHEAMAHTRDQFTTLREEFAQKLGLQIIEVAEFDLALAHLRVPETV